MVLTNKFTVAFNYDAIIRDFDIFVVSREEQKWDRTLFLDTQKSAFKALAVQYTFGKNAYVLSKKNSISIQDYKRVIQEEFETAIVKKITKEDLEDEDFCKNHFFYGNRILAQLLLNALNVPKNDEHMYHNISGALLYSHPNWKWGIQGKEQYIYFLKVEFDPGMFLNLKVTTFKKISNFEEGCKYKGARYIIDPDSGFFRKRLSTDTVKEYYVLGSRKKNKMTVTYCDFKNIQRFKACKLGVLKQFLDDVKDELNEYITLHQEIREEALSFDVNKKESNENLNFGNLIREKGLMIKNELHLRDSKKIIAELVTQLKTYYGIDAQIGELCPTSYNIRLIHNDEYYETNNLKDPHDDVFENYIIQHFTIEDKEKFLDSKSSSTPSPIVDKIIQELLLKRDVIHKNVSIYDWKKLETGKEWSFVKRETKWPDNDTDSNKTSEKKKPINEYTMLTIDTVGNMVFTTFDNQTISDCKEKNIIQRTYDDAEKKSKSLGCSVEGLIFSNIESIHTIIRTAESTMPNINTIWSALYETDNREHLYRDTIIQYLDDFKSSYPEFSEYCRTTKKALQKLDEKLTKGSILKVINVRKKAGKYFNRFTHEAYEQRFSPEIKSSFFNNIYNVENVLDIKYFMDENSIKEGTCYYYVGTKKSLLQQSIHNSCIVRKVVSTGDIQEFKELFPLLSVEFVRNKQYTVLPFPFKYLREYEYLHKNEL